MNPRLLSTIILGAALLALSGAIYIGADLYRGLTEGSFSLVRGAPITREDGLRYSLVTFGEGTGVLVLLGCAVVMLKVFATLRKS